MARAIRPSRAKPAEPYELCLSCRVKDSYMMALSITRGLSHLGRNQESPGWGVATLCLWEGGERFMRAGAILRLRASPSPLNLPFPWSRGGREWGCSALAASLHFWGYRDTWWHFPSPYRQRGHPCLEVTAAPPMPKPKQSRLLPPHQNTPSPPFLNPASSEETLEQVTTGRPHAPSFERKPKKHLVQSSVCLLLNPS